jgi:hypothetical protein
VELIAELFSMSPAAESMGLCGSQEIRMIANYIPQNQSEHGRTEELQWARIFSNGNPVDGMIIVFVQKMCAAFHEFEPAYRAGGLNEGALPFFCKRLAGRVRVVLTALELNGLQGLDGFAELTHLEAAALQAGSLAELADLAEPIHRANHILTDALDKR